MSWDPQIIGFPLVTAEISGWEGNSIVYYAVLLVYKKKEN